MGVIFAHDADPAVKEALTDLLKLREEQAGNYFKLYEKGDGIAKVWIEQQNFSPAMVLHQDQ